MSWPLFSAAPDPARLTTPKGCGSSIMGSGAGRVRPAVGLHSSQRGPKPDPFPSKRVSMARQPVSGPDRPTTRRIGALRALWPFLRPYRGLTLAALTALVLTAGINLLLPLAVRQVVDGFDQGIDLLDRYFAAAIVVVAGLAVGTGLRYALVTRLGERVVADIRKAVFDR